MKKISSQKINRTVKEKVVKSSATSTRLAKRSVVKKTKPTSAKKRAVKGAAVPVVTVPKTRNQNVEFKKPLPLAPEDKKFWMNNGEVLSSLLDLATTFSLIEKMIFDYHVTKQKNDFAEWVEHVLEDAQCAAALRKAKTPRSAKVVVVRHLKQYDW